MLLDGMLLDGMLLDEMLLLPQLLLLLLPQLHDKGFRVGMMNDGGSQQPDRQRSVSSAHRLQSQAFELARQRQTGAGSAGSRQQIVHFLQGGSVLLVDVILR